MKCDCVQGCKPSCCTKENITKAILIPQRYLLTIMAFLAVCNAYQMRVCLNVAITEMVVDFGSKNNSVHKIDVCPELQEEGTSKREPPPGTVLFEWDEEDQGLILSSFYWGYLISHVPGGILADEFGGKYTLGVGLILTSLFTLIIPAAANWGYSWLLFTRFITGLGEGTTYPAINNLLAQWVPLGERAFLGSFVYAGGQIGSIAGTLVSGALLESYRGHWQIVFYFFGSIGLIWCGFFFLLCYSSPDVHPFIKESERTTLKEKIVHAKKVPNPPWLAIFSSVPVWALIGGQIGHDWGFYTMVTDLPKYMKDVLKYSIGTNAALSSLPYLFMWIVSIAGGWTCDRLIKRKVLSVTAARKVFTALAGVVPSIGLIGASYAGCNRAVVVALFCLALGFMGCFYPGMKVNSLDLSPNYAGTVMAIVNGVGAITGIIAPYLVGVITTDHTIPQWRTVFWITVGVKLSTGLIFLLFSSGEVQPWNDVIERDSRSEERRQ